MSALSAIYIPGVNNWQADSPSRDQIWGNGPYPWWSSWTCVTSRLNVHLLACRFGNRIDLFVSRYRNLLMEAVDVLVVSWDQYSLSYAFPPLKLLTHLLCRIKMGGILVIIVLDWPMAWLFKLRSSGTEVSLNWWFQDVQAKKTPKGLPSHMEDMFCLVQEKNLQTFLRRILFFLQLGLDQH